MIWNRCIEHPERLTKNPGGKWCGTCINARYRKNNPKLAKIRASLYYLNNQESISKKAKKRHAKDPSKRREYSARYHTEHREERLAYFRERRKLAGRAMGAIVKGS